VNTSIQRQLLAINGLKVRFAEEGADTYADLVIWWWAGYVTAGPR
jgi:hypothetical protein